MHEWYTITQKLDAVLSTRASGHTKRWHTLPHIGQQTVAEHSAQALSILLVLHPGPSLNLVTSVLMHDHAERIVGDIPAPVLRANPLYAEIYAQMEAETFQSEFPFAHDAMQSMTEVEKKWAKGVDILELILWCEDQIMLGNQHAKIVAGRGRGYIRNKEGMPQEVLAFLDCLDEEGMRSFA